MEIKPHASRPIKPHQLVGNGPRLSSEKSQMEVLDEIETRRIETSGSKQRSSEPQSDLVHIEKFEI